EIAAGAVAADGDAVGVDVERTRAVSDAFGGRVTIVRRGRKFVFGGEPVVDRHGDAAGAGSEITADDVVGLETANDPSAAVEVDQRAKGTAAGGAVNADGDFAGGA